MGSSPYEVKFLHFREVDSRGNVNPRGGATVAYRTNRLETDETIVYSGARCSRDDNFDKRMGRFLSRKRLDEGEDFGVALGVQSEKEFALLMEQFLNERFGYVRKFSRKNRHR